MLDERKWRISGVLNLEERDECVIDQFVIEEKHLLFKLLSLKKITGTLCTSFLGHDDPHCCYIRCVYLL